MYLRILKSLSSVAPKLMILSPMRMLGLHGDGRHSNAVWAQDTRESSLGLDLIASTLVTMVNEYPKHVEDARSSACQLLQRVSSVGYLSEVRTYVAQKRARTWISFHELIIRSIASAPLTWSLSAVYTPIRKVWELDRTEIKFESMHSDQRKLSWYRFDDNPG